MLLNAGAHSRCLLGPNRKSTSELPRTLQPSLQPQHGIRHYKSRSCRLSSSDSSSSGSSVITRSLPRIADFIRDECPIRGLDGTFREQPARPGTELQDTIVLQMHEESLLVPGQRQLMYVHEHQLERIISDSGAAILACLQPPPAGSTAATAASVPPRLLSPARGSWAVVAVVVGVQRLPGSSRALVRLMVTDRVAVQALSAAGEHLVLGRSALLRDRWCYFVRTAALVSHLDGQQGSTSSTSSTSSNGNGAAAAADAAVLGAAAGRDVVNAVQQVQDAATELLQLLQQLLESVEGLVDAADGSGATAGAGTDNSSSSSSSSLQQQLAHHEAAGELAELLCWCEMSGGSAGAAEPHSQPLPPPAAAAAAGSEASAGESTAGAVSGVAGGAAGGLYGPDGLLPADHLLMERAWRLSFAPFAAQGLAAALGVDVGTGKGSSSSSSSSSSSREVLEMMDLGLRLEAAWELGQALRQKMSARLSLEKLNS